MYKLSGFEVFRTYWSVIYLIHYVSVFLFISIFYNYQFSTTDTLFRSILSIGWKPLKTNLNHFIRMNIKRKMRFRVKNDLRTYDNSWKVATVQVNDYTRVCLNLIWILMLYVPHELWLISAQFFVLNLDSWFDVLSNKFIIFWYSIIILLYQS